MFYYKTQSKCTPYCLLCIDCGGKDPAYQGLSAGVGGVTPSHQIPLFFRVTQSPDLFSTIVSPALFRLPHSHTIHNV